MLLSGTIAAATCTTKTSTHGTVVLQASVSEEPTHLKVAVGDLDAVLVGSSDVLLVHLTASQGDHSLQTDM